MTDRTESGRYSLAGFVYQIVGSGVEAFRISKDENESNQTRFLQLEQHGQDLVGRPADDSCSIRLIQFKHSSTDAVVKPSELRTILQKFVTTVRGLAKNIDDFIFELHTNRGLNPNIDDWFKARTENDREKLRQAIKKTSRKGEVENLDAICEVFDRFDYHILTDAELKSVLDDSAAKLGMLKSEIEDGITRLIGYLARKSGESGERRVSAMQIRSEFAGHPNACELLSDLSIEMRRKVIDRFQQGEAGIPRNSATAPIIPRSKTEDIFLALLQYPLVVVHGNGGCGKSIAVADVLMSCLDERDRPPGFCLITRAEGTTPSRINSQIAQWRNCSHHSDDANFSIAFERLKSAFPSSPVLAICFDGIDEKHGETLGGETQSFIRDVIQLASESRTLCEGPLVSVILTCRDKHEMEDIFRAPNQIQEESVNYIHIGDYDNDEMTAAAQRSNGLSREVAERISRALCAGDLRTAASRGRNVDIPNEVVEFIRHPVLWYLFSQLNVEQQQRCLAGDQQALHHLGNDYLKWFRKKAACRITNLQYGQCAAAMREAAKTFADANDIGFFRANWLQPVDDYIGNRLLADLLYKEAISAGLILLISQRDKSWRWRHPWFCNFLKENEGDLQ